jgi:hypothetical protein
MTIGPQLAAQFIGCSLPTLYSFDHLLKPLRVGKRGDRLYDREAVLRFAETRAAARDAALEQKGEV